MCLDLLLKSLLSPLSEYVCILLYITLYNQLYFPCLCVLSKIPLSRNFCIYIIVQDSIIWHFLQMIGRFCQNSLVTQERRSAPATLRSIDVQQFVKAQLNARNQYFLLSQHASPLSLP